VGIGGSALQPEKAHAASNTQARRKDALRDFSPVLRETFLIKFLQDFTELSEPGRQVAVQRIG
jgi:hypothetical protein